MVVPTTTVGLETSPNTLSGLLYYGDNLEVLRHHIQNQSIDLIYLDPPFNSNQNYHPPITPPPETRGRSHIPPPPLCREGTKGGGKSGEIQAQPRAFEDTWRWDDAALALFEETAECGPERVSRALRAFRTLLGESDMLAYLSMMALRLVELRRGLRPTGSIYLHCDQTAGAHLRLLMDAVFGPENFLNHIVWCYGLGGSSSRYWPRKHDDILWYSKVPGRHYFDAVKIPATSQRMKGQRKKAPDYWHIPTINNMARERLGYPTQKPEALLERIIASSSREDDTVLDPFCGCGTALAVAARLRRRWIGIDNNRLAIDLTSERVGIDMVQRVHPAADQIITSQL